MEKIWSNSADLWRKGIHTALSHNNTSGTEFLKLHRHVHGPFLERYCMWFPSNIHPNSCTLTEDSRVSKVQDYIGGQLEYTVEENSLLYSKACSPVQTSYKRKLVAELVYSIPNLQLSAHVFLHAHPMPAWEFCDLQTLGQMQNKQRLAIWSVIAQWSSCLKCFELDTQTLFCPEVQQQKP